MGEGLLFILNQKELGVAELEAKTSVYGKNAWSHKERTVDGALHLPGARKARTHLGLTRRIIRIIARCAPGNLRPTIADIAWRRHVRGTFRVTLTKETGSGGFTEGELAGIIWRSMKTPRVDLERPDHTIDIVITSSQAYIGIRLWENTEHFQERRSHLLPALHPSGTHPALARALVNIAAAKRVHDPFCGSGGFLIEASLAGAHASGADISPEMIARARKNCAAFHLRPELRVADATMWVPRVGAIVTDLPYGKSTRPVALQHLIEAFLARAAQSTSRVVMGLPHEARFPKAWAVRAHLTSYVHKSMTKHLYVLDRK